MMDARTIKFMLDNMADMDQIDRSYIWTILYSHVKSCKIHPRIFVEAALKSIPNEKQEITFRYLLSKIDFIMDYYLDSYHRPKLQKLTFDVLHKKMQGLHKNASFRNLIVDNMLSFAFGKD